MRSLISVRTWSVYGGAVLALALILGSTAAVDAKRPPKPTPTPTPTPSGSLTIAIAPSGLLEPSGQYANVDVTATCPVGWTWSYGRLYVLQGDRGGAGTFSVACTGTPQVARARVVNGMGFQLGSWTATAYVGIVRNGQLAEATSTRTIRLEPEVTVRVADQGQLTGSTGGGVRIAMDVACPTGATGVSSGLTVSQNGSSQGAAAFTPICDGTTHTFLLSITASRGVFHTGSALADAFPIVDWNGQGFYGFDSRTITLLESSTGDSAPPTTPAGLSAMMFGTGDGETHLTWGASTDNATPTGQIVYEIYLNGQFDQAVGSGQTKAILYVALDTLNTLEVIAVDGAGNRSVPATTTVDTRS
jgi:hypothetical protein